LSKIKTNYQIILKSSRRSSITSSSTSAFTTSSRSNQQLDALTSDFNVTVVRKGIAKPHGNLAKNVRKVLDLDKDVYQGYRVS